jgi:hypothetical protein
MGRSHPAWISGGGRDHLNAALLLLIRMKRRLLRLHPLYQFLNPIEHSLIGLDLRRW